LENLRVFPMGHRDLDICQPEQIEKRLLEVRPTVLLNCAAFTDVDGCEGQPDVARRVNTLGPWNLARAAGPMGIFLIHISTDYVFDGKRPPPHPYTEEDPPSPSTVYGRSKWEGEEAVRAATEDHLIIRTGWLYGRYGRSFPRSILFHALKGGNLKVVDDQFGSPTWSRSLARQIRLLMEARVKGTVHATSGGHCSWFVFAREFLQAMNISVRVQPCSTEEYPRPAPRPANSILENRRLRSIGMDIMPPWEADLHRFVEVHGETLREEVREKIHQEDP